MAKSKKRKTKVKKAKRAASGAQAESKKDKAPGQEDGTKDQADEVQGKETRCQEGGAGQAKDLQNSDDGRGLRLTAGLQNAFRRASIHHVCLPAEADLINAEGFRVRLPVRGRTDPVVLDSQKLPGKVTASGSAGVNPKDFDLIGLAMQEPQYRSPGVRELLDAVAKSRVPCMSIMNMPPLPYVKRIPGLDYDALKPAYTDPTVWDNFDPTCLTLCSPDPQAIRPPDEKVNVLMVTLPTNFKVAKFDNEKGNVILRQLEKEIDAVRFDPGDGTKIELPVKLRVHDSIFVPLAKWAMLLAGNYRCITEDGMRTAQEAVHSNLEEVARRSTISYRPVREARRLSRAIWCRSRNTPPPRRVSHVRPRPRARCKNGAPNTSNAPTSWCS